MILVTTSNDSGGKEKADHISCVSATYVLAGQQMGLVSCSFEQDRGDSSGLGSVLGSQCGDPSQAVTSQVAANKIGFMFLAWRRGHRLHQTTLSET